MKSLESNYEAKHNDDSISENAVIAYEDLLNQREKQILLRIGEYVLN